MATTWRPAVDELAPFCALTMKIRHFCIKLELTLRAHVTQKVFYASGPNFFEQLILPCPFNIQRYFCSSIRVWNSYANGAHILNKDPPLGHDIKQTTQSITRSFLNTRHSWRPEDSHQTSSRQIHSTRDVLLHRHAGNHQPKQGDCRKQGSATEIWRHRRTGCKSSGWAQRQAWSFLLQQLSEDDLHQDFRHLQWCHCRSSFLNQLRSKNTVRTWLVKKPG